MFSCGCIERTRSVGICANKHKISVNNSITRSISRE